MNPLKSITRLYGWAAAPVLWACVLATAAEPKTQPDRDFAGEIKQLQQERIDALTQIVDMVHARYLLGQMEFSRVAGAHAELVNAILDGTEKPAPRVALLQEQLKLARTILEHARQRQAAGAGPESDVLQAKASMLDIKIKLLREQARAKAAAE